MARDGLVQNRVIYITGAGSGIGRATAILAAAEGALIAAADLSEAGGRETVAMLQKAGAKAMFSQVDVAKAASVKASIDETVRHFGRIDGAFNNAGIAENPSESWDDETFDRVISINLKGVMLCMKHELPHMANKGGAIVNTSSIMGVAASSSPAGYIASKHGVVGLTKMAALQYATQKVRVNAVCPGAVWTPMNERLIARDPSWEEPLKTIAPMNRMAEASEIAEAVIWLLSDRASYVTGHAMMVDGGFFAR